METKVDYTLLPKALSVESIPENRRPLPDDWKIAQGGMPEVVFVEPGLYNVVHSYLNLKDSSGTGAIVPTSISTLVRWENKTVIAIINGRQVEFPIALLWQYHGSPCEKRSKASYKRVAVAATCKVLP